MNFCTPKSVDQNVRAVDAAVVDVEIELPHRILLHVGASRRQQALTVQSFRLATLNKSDPRKLLCFVLFEACTVRTAYGRYCGEHDEQRGDRCEKKPVRSHCSHFGHVGMPCIIPDESNVRPPRK